MLLGALTLCAPAAAQTPATPPPPSVLLVEDASDSMAKDAGNGQTRLQATKAALTAAVDVLPPSARVGLRLYGHRRSNVSRRVGCRDTQLVSPIGPVDKPALKRTIASYEAKGRTPIGRSLREAGKDLQGSPGRRVLVLVSDGGDNCAPPDPCRVARKIAAQGTKLTITSVGFQVSGRARAQLECIAEAGGGRYIDAADPEELAAELQALFARAFRDYTPKGKPIEGGASQGEAAAIDSGAYLDSISAAGQERWYKVNLAWGERLWATATIVRPDTVRGDASRSVADASPFTVDLVSPTAPKAEFGSVAFFPQLRDVGGRGESLTVKSAPVGGDDSDYARPGTYFVKVGLGLISSFATVDFPLELRISRLARLPSHVPAEPAALVRAIPKKPAGSAKPDGEAEDGGGPPAGIVALLAALAGLVGGAALALRRGQTA